MAYYCGYIKLHRKLLDSQMYKHLTSRQRDVMVVLLMLANWTENEWEWKGKLFKCAPGQFITSLNSIKTLCASDLTIQNIRTALAKLEKWRFLTNESTKKGRLITIINWDRYQVEENKSTKQPTDSQQTANKQLTNRLTPNEEYKNLKKNKELKEKTLESAPKNQIPYKKIIHLYHSILPSNPHINDDTNIRPQIRGRWNTKPEYRNLAWWKSFFTMIEESDFLTGRTDTEFIASLDWITKKGNFSKILNRNYENRRSQKMSKTLSHNVNVVKGMFNGKKEPTRVG